MTKHCDMCGSRIERNESAVIFDLIEKDYYLKDEKGKLAHHIICKECAEAFLRATEKWRRWPGSDLRSLTKEEAPISGWGFLFGREI